MHVEDRWGRDYEAPRFLCVPLPPYVAHHASDWLSPDTPKRTVFENLILVSEGAVLALICFLHVARDGIHFKKKCKDPRLYQPDSEGGYGRLLHLPEVMCFEIRDMGVRQILSRRQIAVPDSERALECSIQRWIHGCSKRAHHMCALLGGMAVGCLDVDVGCTPVVGYSTTPDGLPTCGHVLARLWTTTVWLGKSRFNF